MLTHPVSMSRMRRSPLIMRAGGVFTGETPQAPPLELNRINQFLIFNVHVCLRHSVHECYYANRPTEKNHGGVLLVIL